MANFVFKKTETTNMKIAGIIDTDKMTVDIDGEEKSLATLLSVFNGTGVEIKVATKNEEELDEPTDND